MRFLYLIDIARTVAGDRGYLCRCASRQGEPRDRRSAQIVEVEISVAKPRTIESFAP
jgi:hypothetical protein